MPEKKQHLVKSLLFAIIILALVTSNAITLKLYLDEKITNDSSVIQDTADELSRVKFFIKDWFDDLTSRYGEPSVFHNELRFQGGKYPLTISGDRIRAVYPRGERYFQMEYVSYIEFYIESGHIICKMYYLDTGEYVLRLS